MSKVMPARRCQEMAKCSVDGVQWSSYNPFLSLTHVDAKWRIIVNSDDVSNRFPSRFAAR